MQKLQFYYRLFTAKPTLFFRIKIDCKTTFQRFPLRALMKTLVGGGVRLWSGDLKHSNRWMGWQWDQERKYSSVADSGRKYLPFRSIVISALNWSFLRKALFLKVFYELTKISISTNKMVFLICSLKKYLFYIFFGTNCLLF